MKRFIQIAIKVFLFIMAFAILANLFWEIQRIWLGGKDVLVVSNTRLGDTMFFIVCIPWIFLAYFTIRKWWKKDWGGLKLLGLLHLIFQPIFLLVIVLSLNSYLVVTNDEIIRSDFFQRGSDSHSLDRIEKITLEFQESRKGDDYKYYTLHFEDGSSKEIWYHGFFEEEKLLKVDRLLRQKKIPKEILNTPDNLDERPRAVQNLYSE